MALLLLSVVIGLAAYYLNHVNSAMKAVPEEARNSSPRRWTVDEIKSAYQKMVEKPIDVTKSIPPKQTRRYVVVGGSGEFLPMAMQSRPKDRQISQLKKKKAGNSTDITECRSGRWLDCVASTGAG